MHFTAADGSRCDAHHKALIPSCSSVAADHKWIGSQYERLTMRKSVAPAAASVVVAASMLVWPAPSLAESKIGVASVAKNQVHGILGGTTRAMSAGSELFSNETVRTGEASQAQLLFLDQTSLSVGARSEVKLDRFVYNPDRKAGNVVIETSRGAFRFVSGSQNPSNYTIKTPLATIGVRGTILRTHAAPGCLVA
jgi:hypothetical protein